jgi:hypothetical protein
VIRRPRVFVVALAASALLVGPAHAQWSSSATGPAAATSTTLGAPTGLTATCGGILGGLLGKVVTLTWPPSPSANLGTMSYQVLRGTSSGGPYPWTSEVTTSLTFETDTLSNGTYYFVVQTAAGLWRSPNSIQRSRSIGLFGCS